MKISASKNTGFKQLALKHSEKAGGVLIALLVVFALLKTDWATISSTPEELSQKATEAKIKVAQSQWTLDERKIHPQETGLQNRLLAMKGPISLGKYLPDVSFSFPLRDLSIAMRVPFVLKIENLLAKKGRVFHEITLVDVKDNKQNVKGAKTDPDPMGVGPLGIPIRERKKKENQKKKNKDKNKKEKDGREEGLASFKKKPKKHLPGGGPAMKSIDGVGRRYIVVLGVFDLKAQIQEFALALGLSPSVIRSQNLANIAHFKIQRRRVDQAGKGLTDWIDFDSQNTVDVLFLSPGFESEVIDSKYVNPVITSPLLSIVPQTSEWGDNVTHPRMSVVDGEIQELQKKFDDLIREYLKKEQKKKSKDPLINEYGKRLSGGEQVSIEEILKDKKKRDRIISKIVEGLADGDPNKKLVKAMVEARRHQNLLMFRFFDFDVQSNRWYQHRVKIVMINPLSKSNESDAKAGSGNPKGEAGTGSGSKITADNTEKSRFIESEWSDPTAPSSPGSDYSYYLTEAKNGRSLGSFPSINVELFEWIQKYGMFTKAIFANLVIGNPIGGTMKTEIPEPLYPRFIKIPVTFDTQNYLVDIDTAPELDSVIRESLSLGRDFYRDTGITEQITVVDEYGKLKVIDKLSSRREREAYSRRLEDYVETFADMREKKDESDDQSGLGGGK